jgi:hypothetical protein
MRQRGLPRRDVLTMQPQGIPPGAVMPAKKTNPLVWVLGGCAVVLVLGGIAVAGAVWWGYQKAKSYAESGEMKAVAQLWSDVPPLEGMTPSQQTEMPLPLRMIARPFLDALMRGLNNGKEAGHWDVAFYVLSGKTTHDVEAFYVPARMGKYGWQGQGGCTNMNQVTFCSYQKHDGNKAAGLLVMAADDQEHKSTALYFIRQDARNTGNASGGQ